MDSPSSSSESSSTLPSSESSSSSPPASSSSNESSAKASHRVVLLRCSIALGFMFICILSLSYTFGFFALLFAKFSIPPPISVLSQCKIVSTSVDLRSSKICELGLLNYKAKRVFYPSERKKFCCRYDYYWASIFKVEYRDQFSGQTLFGLAEVPQEALPSDCRPNFSTAWLTKHMLKQGDKEYALENSRLETRTDQVASKYGLKQFLDMDSFEVMWMLMPIPMDPKVNETYDCWYTSGRSKVEIFQDSYFGCQAKDPSLFEMMRRYSILFTKMMQSWLSGQLKTKHMRWGVILGVIGGFLSAMISFTLLTLCSRLLCLIPRAAVAMVTSLIHRVIFSRIFFLVAYFSIVSWLAIQYGKRLGLPELFIDY